MIYHRPDKPVGDNEYKMKMNRTLYSILLAITLLLAYACHKPDNGAGQYIKEVKCSNVKDNSLRVSIDTKFNQDCEYSISYWPKDDPSKAFKTKARHSEGLEGNDVLLYLYPESTYCFTIQIEGTDAEPAGPFEFQTYSLPEDLPKYSVTEGAGNRVPGYFFQTQITSAGYVMISDTDGRVIWYQYVDQPTRQFDFGDEDGVIWILTGFKYGYNSELNRMIKRILCIDLFGNVLHEWSVIDNEIDLPYAHHDIRRMPDGNIAVVSNFTREFDMTALGGEPGTTLWGDGFAIFNTKGEVLRTWDIFGTVDPLNCSYIDPVKYPLDLVHANSVNWDSEGNFYMTFNHSSQLWKIDSKTGKVLYRVGPEGNVALDESGFSQGLHAAVPLAPDRVLCLDNGEQRKSSRAIIYNIDPVAMTATVDMSVNIDQVYSSQNRSNVELVANGTMLMFGMTESRYVVFTDLEGNVLKAIHREDMSYRTHYLEKLPEY